MNLDPTPQDGWKRRDFVLLGAAALGWCGCQAGSGSSGAGAPRTTASTAGGPTHLVDAGPASNFVSEGVYSNNRDLGFFLVRHGSQLMAISSYCTHRNCKLEAGKDHSFTCPCHGSEFSPTGKVKTGPATQDLPILSVVTDARGHVMVSVLNV